MNDYHARPETAAPEPGEPEIQTARLKILCLTPGMARAVHALSLDEINRRFMPDEVFETEADAAAAIRELMGQYGRMDGPLVYAVQQKDGTQVGHVEAVPIAQGWEIGYHIGAAYAGRGYATEAVRAFAPEMLRRLGITRLYGICVEENIASRRVMEKAGFSLEYAGIGMYGGPCVPLRRYAWPRP